MLPSRCEPLRIHLFGQPRFFIDGKPFKFSAPPRALPLLAFLLLNRDAHLTRDGVAFALWPDDDEETARTKLRRHLNYLKGALPPTDTPWFIAEGETIVWNDDAAAWLDVDRFEACAKTDSALDEALELYAGDLLPALYDDWLIVVRDRLRSQYLVVLDALLMRARSRRTFATAMGFARRILAEDPWREDTLRQLMSIRYESGDRTGALHDYSAFAERLQRELGVEPMPETLALRDAVLRGAVLPEAGAPPDDPFQWTTSAIFPFVGRRPELELLRTTWTRAARGRGASMLLAGAAGSGKSRLAAELALFAGAQGGRVLFGATSAPERMPYQSIADALRATASEVSALDLRPIWLAALSALVPEIGLRRTDLPALPALDTEREQLRLFEAVAQCLHALARRRPLLVVLEDLHWAGASTLAAFEFLVRRAGAQARLLLGTYRSEEVNAGDPLAAFRRRVAQENLVAPVALGELELGDVCELVATLPALADQAQEIGAQIHAASGGNALFVGELLRDRLETTALHASRAMTLRQTIEARADRLSKPAQVFAEIASVVGDTFDIDVIREVSAAGENELFDGIAELLDRRIVKEIGLGRFSFAFAHHLIAQAVYGRIPEAQRRRWHRRVAVVLGRLSADDAVVAPAVLARHYDLGGDARRAVEQYLLTAGEARAVGANDEARAAAARGLELATEPDRLRFDLLLQNESSASLLGQRDEQERMLDELRDLATRLGDVRSSCEVTQRSIRLARARSDRNLEEKLIDELTQITQSRGDVRWEAVALQERATHLRTRSQYAQAVTEASKALNAFRSVSDGDGEVETLCLLAEIAYMQSSSAEMQHYIERARSVADAHQKKGPIARATLAAAGAAIMRREFAPATALSQAALELYREMGDREGEGEALERLASASAMLGRLDEARTTRSRAAQIFADLGKRSSLGHLLFNGSATEMQLGLLDDAVRSLDAACEIFEALDDERGRAACASNLSMVRLLQGNAEEAKAAALRSLEAARAIETAAIEAAALSNLGNAERELREFDAALEHMYEAILLRERLGRPATFEELADFALTQLESGDVGAAHDTAQAMLAQTETSDENTVWPHYCFWIAARIFRAAGDGERAAPLLAHAYQTMQTQERAIAEQPSRTAFAALEMNRLIRAAAEQNDWPPTARAAAV